MKLGKNERINFDLRTETNKINNNVRVSNQFVSKPRRQTTKTIVALAATSPATHPTAPRRASRRAVDTTA